MKAVIYIRVSSKDQNPARQEKALEGWANRDGITEVQTVVDKVSGSVPFIKRGAGFILEDDEVSLLVVKSIDRLGRNTIDILQTIESLHAKGITIAIHDLGMVTLLEDGSANPAAKMIISVMATIAEMERETMLERQAEGIKIAKRQGKYKGRQAGTAESRDKFLAKHQDIARQLKKGKSVRDIAKITSKSTGTVQKVKRLIAA